MNEKGHSIFKKSRNRAKITSARIAAGADSSLASRREGSIRIRDSVPACVHLAHPIAGDRAAALTQSRKTRPIYSFLDCPKVKMAAAICFDSAPSEPASSM